jgi:hypothetical protein
MLSPIKPHEVVGKEQEITPDYVIAAFNELIAKNWNGTYSVVGQRSVVTPILKKAEEAGACIYDRNIYDNHWLDVEEIYRAVGWQVEYDKPGYNETYEPTFTFRKEGKS